MNLLLSVLFNILIFLKENVDPEAEYDERFIKSSHAADCVNTPQGSAKYSKVVARKR